jgi:hypothetical protein
VHPHDEAAIDGVIGHGRLRFNLPSLGHSR